MCGLPHIEKDGRIRVAPFGRRDAECGLASAKCTFVCLHSQLRGPLLFTLISSLVKGLWVLSILQSVFSLSEYC